MCVSFNVSFHSRCQAKGAVDVAHCTEIRDTAASLGYKLPTPHSLLIITPDRKFVFCAQVRGGDRMDCVCADDAELECVCSRSTRSRFGSKRCRNRASTPFRRSLGLFALHNNNWKPALTEVVTELHRSFRNSARMAGSGKSLITVCLARMALFFKSIIEIYVFAEQLGEESACRCSYCDYQSPDQRIS